MMLNSSKKSMVAGRLLAIPLSVLLVIALSLPGVAQQTGKKESEKIAPPPPPPPPPPPVKGDVVVEETADVPSEIFVLCEEMPQFPGGDQALIEFIFKNVKYPEDAKQQNIQGRVIMKFVVTAQGDVTQVSVLRGVHPALDNEAVRVIKMLPKWTPGKQGGKPVNVWYNIPITFALDGDKKFTNPALLARQESPKYYIFGSDTLWIRPEVKAEFPGGKDAFKKYLTEKLIYPAEAKNAGFSGTVAVSFNVGKDGKLSGFSVNMGQSPSLDAEALKLARSMPSWTPATVNNRKVMSHASASFTFETAKPSSGDVPEEVFVVVEEMPRYPGGEKALLEYVKNTVQYPAKAKENGIQGRVILRFCVNQNGGIEKVGVLRGVDLSLDQEAIRVVKGLAKWEPGKQGGKPVKVWYNMPVTFALSDSKNTDAPPPPPPPPTPPSYTPPFMLITGYDEPPVYPGGEQALLKFIRQNNIYPDGAKEKNVGGVVTIRAKIGEDGKVSNVSIYNSIDTDLDAAAYAVISKLPDWKPGKLDGKPVSVWYNIPVEFKLK
ncbi:MAG: TonB family protein [Bacteroidales bacterium]